jgi:hypothetical protein
MNGEKLKGLQALFDFRALHTKLLMQYVLSWFIATNDYSAFNPVINNVSQYSYSRFQFLMCLSIINLSLSTWSGILDLESL